MKKLLDYTAILGISAITLITLTSVYHGLDGYNVMTAIVSIAGLGGYVYRQSQFPPHG